MGSAPRDAGDRTSAATGPALALVSLALLLLAGVLVCLDRSVLRAPSPLAGPPNIILISVDSLRRDRLGLYGCRRETSPNLDRFAERAYVFEDFISQAPWTLPSHATMLLGQDPSAHGVDHNFERISPQAITLPRLLQAHDYETIGIVSAPLVEASYGFDNGFDRFDDTLSTKRTAPSYRTVTGDKAVRKALSAIRKRTKARFFLFLHLWDVHYDYMPPAPWDRKFDPDYRGELNLFGWSKNMVVKRFISPRDRDHVVAMYDGEVAWTDSQIGRFLDGLARRGELPNTAVIITADHGEELFDHGGTCHSLTLYEELVRVPFILRLPGQAMGVRVACRAAMVDLMPTVLDLARVPVPDDLPLQGRSLLPLLRGEESCEPEREILTETVWSRHDVPEGTPMGYEIGMYRGRYKITRRLEEPVQDFLFDLALDPQEKDNLAEREPALFQWLAGRLRLRAEENAALHARTTAAAQKALSKETLDTLRSLGYVQD